MTHLLDSPIWTSLATGHAVFAEGDHRARRFPASIAPFAACAVDDAESLEALAALVATDETIVLFQAAAIAVPQALTVKLAAAGVQMVAESPLPRVHDPRIRQLTLDDAADMLALAKATNPGPFTLRALSLGDFWGVHIGGRLAAMAGLRLKQPGYVEVSGVCSHADFRGQGLGRLLSQFVAGEVYARGEIPYLHAFAANTTAIRLYESIGFTLRRRMHVAMLGRAG